jgi:hypothetical protein
LGRRAVPLELSREIRNNVTDMPYLSDERAIKKEECIGRCERPISITHSVELETRGALLIYIVFNADDVRKRSSQ